MKQVINNEKMTIKDFYNKLESLINEGKGDFNFLCCGSNSISLYESDDNMSIDYDPDIIDE